MKRKILFLVTEDWYFWSHRLPLARAARDAGYAVTVATRVDRHGAMIEKEGFTLKPLSLRRRSFNPLRELPAVAEIAALYRAERPDIVHHVAFKPIVYGSVAARWAGISRVVNAFTGLGYVFIARGLKGWALRGFVGGLMKLSLVGINAKAIVQNGDDEASLLSAGLIKKGDVIMIRGSGVDMKAFLPRPEAESVPLVVLPARLLWDKGVGEFVEAARRLKKEGVKARFALVGMQDDENPAAVSEAVIAQWRAAGDVEITGHRDDMPEVFAQSHVVCLPSYREGLPKALLEAAASGRPIVASDAPGCREVVRHEQTGLLVPVRDAAALAQALKRLLQNPTLRRELGAGGRKLVEAEFSQERVCAQTLDVYRSLLNGTGA